MSGGTSKYDGKYNINDKRLVKILYKLYKLGFEAGYHGSFYSYGNLVKMKEEIKSLEKNIQIQSFGCRQHFLRFEIPSTWEIQEKSGLLYDTTLGYAEIEGFRSGICFPYKPFDLIENRVLNIWEIPLIVMDVTLKDEKYRHLNYKDGADVIINLINTVKKYNGVFTLLWHNTSFTDEWNGWTQVYEDTIKYLYELNAFGVSGREVINILNEEIRKAY
ncbi:MAG: polysaccharide deacetylase family protein [Clostridium sp.]|nr:polysaccharide deacetylase family protein [Clostridium sp.]